LATLQRIHIKGFKSIKELDLELRAMNVLIGANGAGKSNFVSFFVMMHQMVAGRLQTHFAKSGRAHSFLHFGPKVTQEIESLLIFHMGEAAPVKLESYQTRWIYEAGDTLAVIDESVGASRQSVSDFHDSLVRSSEEFKTLANNARLSSPESRLAWDADLMFQREYKSIKDLIGRWRIYQFHDTTPTSRLMQYGYIGDSKSLLPDAGNLAAFLYRLKTEAEPAYRRIVATIRQVAPFFDDFVLDPTPQRDIMLNWRDKGSDQVFGPHQLSDGTLRAMGLISLLLQPEDELPGLLIVDEPELGLHPYAVEVIAALFKMSSLYTQVVLCTQSPLFLDHFDPSDVIVVEREGPESTFRRLGETELDLWLERYSLGEIWQKNVIGGGPH
jgi:predicted ATPase